MTFWARLAISVAISAVFYMVMTEFLQGTSHYETYRWYMCSAFLAAGPVLYLIGRRLNATYRAAAAEQAQFGADSEEAPQHEREPFLLFNLAYWGGMSVIMGVIVVFIVPRPDKLKETPAVAARTSLPAKATNAPPVEFPKLHLQGFTYGNRKPSVIFDGRTYFVGERVQGATITAIANDQVTLELDGQTKVLRFIEGARKDSQ